MSEAPAETREREPGPFWWPDLRGVVAAGFLALTVLIFCMIYVNPELTANQGFMFLAQAVIVSGLIGAVGAFLFTTTKSSADVRAQANKAQDQVGKALDALNASQGAPTIGIVPPATVEVSAPKPPAEGFTIPEPKP